MKKMINTVLCLLIIVLVYAGCNKNSVIRSERETKFQKMNLESLLAEVRPEGVFALAENGELYVAKKEGEICRYASDGSLLQTYAVEGYVTTLCLMGDYLFFYTYEDELWRISIEDGKSVILVEQLLLSDMQQLIAAGESLCAFANQEENGQWRTVIVQIDPVAGSTALLETPEGDLRGIYGAADGVLYYCLEKNGSTGLYSYMTEKKESELQYDLTEHLEQGQIIQCFVYEQELFAFTSSTEELTVLSLTEEKSATIPLTGNVTFGKDMICVAGNIMCCTYQPKTDSFVFEHIYLGEMELKTPKTPLKGTVALKGTLALDTLVIEETTGLKTRIEPNAMHSEEFLLEIMAGNPEVDIYILNVSDKVALALKEKGIYVPLNDSVKINEYKEACFPYIAEEMVTETGDIWMLPCRVSAACIWYVEENMKKFGISTEEFQTVDSFFALSKEMKKKLAGTEYRCYVESPANFGNAMRAQYDAVYCDFENGIVNYRTEEFRSFFQEQWSNWVIYSKNPVHPFLEGTLNETGYDLLSEHPKFSTKRVVYKWSYPSAHFEYGAWEGWRVAPEPRISEKIEGNNVNMIGMVVNPYSEQKELAVAYLEAIAENPMKAFAGSNDFPFLFEDMSMYEECYDVMLPAVQDMYRLFQNGYLSSVSYPYPDNFILEYQEGRLTLEEALEKMERDTEMWLNE